MSFPRRHLGEGEGVVLAVHPHWSYLGWAPAEMSATAALVVAQPFVWSTAPTAVGWALDGLLGLSALWLAGRLLRWRATELVVTTSRLVQRSGILGRRGVEVRLDRINEISYHQSIFGRLLGVGQLFVDAGGDSGVVGFDHVRRPGALAALLHQQLDGGDAPGGGDSPWSRRVPVDRRPPSAGGRSARWDDTPPSGALSPGGSSVTQQLIELDELRRRGILSEEEFAERKARLLDRL